MSKVTFVIPCFNEAAALRILLTQLVSCLEKLEISAAIFLVDDGSSDDIEQVFELNRNRSKMVKMKLIQLPTNRGKIYAQAIGVINAEADSAIVLMDGDGQHPVRYLPEIMSVANGTIRVGSRIRYKRSLLNGVGSLLLQGILLTLGVKFAKNESEFVFIPAEYVDKIKQNESLGILPINEVLRSHKDKIEYFQFEVDIRLADPIQRSKKVDSRHDFSKLLHKATLIIFADPWKVLSRMILMLLAFASMVITYGIWIGWNALMSDHPTGLATIIVLTAIFFIITWGAIVIVLAGCLVIREEFRILRTNARNIEL
jgi:glycosyltransferase involved in cell wall biosynthesis